ncbi:inactive N-acetylated-alpha-linked acidic dipeptidase-like protein 2 [Erpetoichthys calabaricus]|uniref:inactive N-acetylated-alpha-linked acidic dipeptidase-like protein 2 n=1 Tax=Erpetoichthys calabaricus TaxID=27687 RepID=UPI00109FD794|nr:inactive N-acetylated-alpha-linked acidic dipeptidase-like protein 2 [Erpetoichthys calabaricus]XP_051779910.1 inactive N-acetylated-alpha-linked acidic dipeptidase-like protein 2 [Erpetoichthys calabaricus]
MAYRKVTADHSVPLHAQDPETDDIQATSLDLEWDMEKELEEPSLDCYQLDSADHGHLGNSSQSTELGLERIQPSVSPQGRFERLQEDPDYVSHYTRQAPKNNQKKCRKLIKYICTGSSLFIFGLLIGHYVKNNCDASASSTNQISGDYTTNSEVYQKFSQEVTAEALRRHFRHFSQKQEEKISIAKSLAEKWRELGLSEVQLFNYTVLLSLPGPSPSNITDKGTGQCFLPEGRACNTWDQKSTANEDLLYNYASYSAQGTLEAEVVDVQYGMPDDLSQALASTNATNKIALLKLGYAPLLYKLSLLEEAGFGGVLPYIDPCDQPNDQMYLNKSFGIALNPGGDPSTPGYPSIDGAYRENLQHLTRLLVQPISASLAKELLSARETAGGNKCSPLSMPMDTGKRTIILAIENRMEYGTIHNVIGYLKGVTNSDRYILVGSHHHNGYDKTAGDVISGAAINTHLIETLISLVKNGWQPFRTIVFCSWGGTEFGKIGSYEWGEEMKEVLLSNAVAYVSLFSPVQGNGMLYTKASPLLRQLAADSLHKKLSLNCTKKEKCSRPNIISVQMQGDADYFASRLGIPSIEFSYQDAKMQEKPSFIPEALFPVTSSVIETLDSSFIFHETLAKLTGEVILRMASEPVLPFSALDMALDIQNKLKDDKLIADQLMAYSGSLRESAQLFQSEEMRPANDPKERDPVHVRMLNDVLQNLEKNFVIPQAPPGFYRNILYALDDKTNQFSILKEAQDHWKLKHLNETLKLPLSMVLNCINSAERHLAVGLDLFEDVSTTKH